MRPLLFLPLLITPALSAMAQGPRPGQTLRSSGTAPVSILHALTIRLSDLRDATITAAASPFSHFEVIDERPDSTRIGVHGNLPMRSHEFDRQLVFDKPASQEIAAFLNRHLARPGAPDTALIILRYLWLSDTDPYTANPDRYQSADNYNNRTNHTHIRLKAEIYALRDHRYLPLLRIDTLQQTRKVTYSILRSTYFGWERDLAAMLQEGMDKAALTFPHRERNSRWIGWDDIRKFNQSRFEVPILDTATLINGVYAAFEEFRNNTPSIRDFEILPENGSLALYLKNGDGSSSYTRKAWGLCNGSQFFIMRDGLLHLIRKDGNSFYFYGIDITASNSSSPPLVAFNGYSEQHCLYIIDLDTGQFY
jgi:hypothetical protein